jgi:hypothetical protein
MSKLSCMYECMYLQFNTKTYEQAYMYVCMFHAKKHTSIFACRNERQFWLPRLLENQFSGVASDLMV